MENNSIVPTIPTEGGIEISVAVFDDILEKQMSQNGMMIKVDGKWYGWNENKENTTI